MERCERPDFLCQRGGKLNALGRIGDSLGEVERRAPIVATRRARVLVRIIRQQYRASRYFQKCQRDPHYVFLEDGVIGGPERSAQFKRHP
jgi:hypothetical protein